MTEPVVPNDVPHELNSAEKEFLAKKTGIMVAIPNLKAEVVNTLSMWLITLSYKTLDPDCPYFFKLFMPQDLTPVEYARNECVREFLRDPYFKKLFFIDADMLPPTNALDLLQYDEPIVSGLCHIWMGGMPDPQTGYYVPPRMKINAFDYRPEHEDFISKLPPMDGRPFYCDAAGAACLVLRRDLLEMMPEPWFRTVRDPYGAGLRSEDLDFCKRANAMGTKVLYCPMVQFGHMKRLDLAEVIKYGIMARRVMIEELKGATPEKQQELIAGFPTVRFSGEEPLPGPDDSTPKDLKVIQGGRR